MIFNKIRTVGIVFFLCCFLKISYADTLDMQLSRDKIALGETVTATYILNNSSVNSPPDFSPLEKDFRVVGTYYGNTINVLNGVSQTQTYWQVTLEPKIAGELWIPEITFGNAKSLPHKLWVEETPVAVPTDQQNTSAFVKAELNTTSPYVQSQVIYTFKLFFRTQLENSKLEVPRIKDGMLVQVGDEKFYQTTIKGERFYVFEKNFVIFPQKTGELIIPPAYFRAAQLNNPNLMDDPFSITTNSVVNLATQSFTLQVRNIPDNYQGKIWLPAKHILLAEKWSSDPRHWQLGNPITRTITIEAHGLRADQIPDLPVEQISGVNVYAETPHRSKSTDGNSVLGSWQQKITYIPNQTQSFLLPNVKLYWWNTQTNTNTVAELNAVNVAVQGKITNSGSTSANMGNLNEIKPMLEQSKDLAIPFYSSGWFWVSIIIFLIWLVTLWLIWKSRRGAPEIPDNRSVIRPEVFNEKSFVKACEEGNSVLAQKQLLMWAKTKWQDSPSSLGKIYEMIDDEIFKKSLMDLEQVLYADGKMHWNGRGLLAAFQQMQKHRSSSLSKGKIVIDPLPPLYP